MQIKISFNNINANATGIRVYRSTSVIDPNNLPAVYATIDPSSTSYTDTSVINGQLYYYMFAVFSATETVLSNNIQATAAAYVGPGPQILKYGDLDAGYYGIVASTDFMTWDALISWSGIPVNLKNANTIQDWLKFAHKGKILFVPKQPLMTASWASLYLAGLVYGTNDNGPRDYNTQVATNQMKTINVQGSNFKVRLLNGLPPGFDLTTAFTTSNGAATSSLLPSTPAWDSTDTTLNLEGSEWNDLFYKLVTWTPPSQRGKNWDKLDALIAANGNVNYIGCGGDSMFMELASTNQHITRGLNATNAYQPGTVGTHSTTVATQQYWRPVLEMI